MIKKKGDKWELWSQDGSKLLGTHDSEESAKAQEQAIEANKHREHALQELGIYGADVTTIKDVDIFAVGTWFGSNSPKSGDVYTLSDLNSMVEAYNSGVVKPNIKITHGSDNEQIDLGRIENLRVKDNRLWGDFIDIPKSLYDLMKKGLFSKRSAEVLWKLKDNAGKVWPKVLKAVALLAPGQQPAVSVLNEGYTFEKAYCYEYTEKSNVLINGDFIDEEFIERVVIKIFSSLDKNNSIYKLIKSMEAKKTMSLEDLIKKYGVKDEAELETILSDGKKAMERLKEYETTKKTNAINDAKKFVDDQIKEGKILPKDKDPVVKNFETLINAGDTKGVEDMKVYISSGPKRVDTQEHSHVGGEQRTYDKTKPSAQEVDRIVKELVGEGKAKTYADALKIVQTEHKELWAAYLKA